MPLSSKTLELSTEEALREVLTLCREGSPVRTSQMLGRGGGLKKEIEADSGMSSPESFAKLSPDLCWLKTSGGYSQLMMEGGSELFFETWPRSGTMRNGSCFQPPTQGLLTEENESGLWPTPPASQARSEGMILQMRAKVEAGEITREEAERMIGGSLTPARMTKWATPTARDGKGSDAPGRLGTPSLCEQVKMWPTPRANDGEKRGDIANDPRNGLPSAAKYWRTPKATDGSNGGPNARDSSGGLHLSAQAAQFPTPRTRNLCGGSGSRQMLDKLAEDGTISSQDHRAMSGGGKLNPTWVEWLMGWPLEWTVLDAQVTEWFRIRQRKPGKKSYPVRE